MLARGSSASALTPLSALQSRLGGSFKAVQEYSFTKTIVIFLYLILVLRVEVGVAVVVRAAWIFAPLNRDTAKKGGRFKWAFPLRVNLISIHEHITANK